MRFVVDMNLPPAWVAAFQAQGYGAVHWSEIGDPKATDRTILEWADREGYIVFTHDLDFGALLAASGASGPSVIQVRTQDVTPDALSNRLFAAIQQFEPELQSGALVSVDLERSRARILPMRGRQ